MTWFKTFSNLLFLGGGGGGTTAPFAPPLATAMVSRIYSQLFRENYRNRQLTTKSLRNRTVNSKLELLTLSIQSQFNTTINNLIASMAKRICLVIARKGSQRIKY